MSSQVSFEQDNSPLVKFLRALVQIFKGYFIVVGMGVSAVMALIVISVMAASTSTSGDGASVSLDETTPQKLTLQLNGPLAKRAPAPEEQLWGAIFGGKPKLYVPNLRAALRRAMADPVVGGLEIELQQLSGSLAEIVELRNVLTEFRASGKPIRIYLNDASGWNYYLATAADEIVISPAASLYLPGPIFTLVYFSEALKKVGVGLDVLRVGKFKSAIEPFIRMSPSDEAREQYESMESSLRDYLVQVVAESRGVDPTVAQRWFRESIYTAQASLDEGMVDAIGYYQGDAEDKTELKMPEKGLKYSKYKQADRSEHDWEVAEDSGGIGLIEAVGEIVMNSDDPSDDVITPLRMRKQLRWAKDNEDVKVVVLRVSSPGGSALASDMIWKEVADLSAVKPVIVSMGAAAASGGYYISAPATHIIAEPTTITGSIGVFGLVPNVSQFEEKYGVSLHVVTQTERSAFFNPGTPATSFDRTMVEVTLDQIYTLFIKKVGAGRGMTTDQVDDIAQGRVYTGLEAVQIGLVDSLGGLHDAITKAKELAGFDVSKLYPVMTYQPDDLNLRDCLMRPDRWDTCFGGTGTRILQTTNPTEKWERRVLRWTDDMQRGRALTLWTGWWASNVTDENAGLFQAAKRW